MPKRVFGMFRNASTSEFGRGGFLQNECGRYGVGLTARPATLACCYPAKYAGQLECLSGNANWYRAIAVELPQKGGRTRQNGNTIW